MCAPGVPLISISFVLMLCGVFSAMIIILTRYPYQVFHFAKDTEDSRIKTREKEVGCKIYISTCLIISCELIEEKDWERCEILDAYC